MGPRVTEIKAWISVFLFVMLVVSLPIRTNRDINNDSSLNYYIQGMHRYLYNFGHIFFAIEIMKKHWNISTIFKRPNCDPHPAAFRGRYCQGRPFGWESGVKRRKLIASTTGAEKFGVSPSPPPLSLNLWPQHLEGRCFLMMKILGMIVGGNSKNISNHRLWPSRKSGAAANDAIMYGASFLSSKGPSSGCSSRWRHTYEPQCDLRKALPWLPFPLSHNLHGMIRIE